MAGNERVARPDSIVINNNFHGPVGVNQTGSNNTANVVQQVSDTGELFRYIAQLRGHVEQLPDDKRDEALEAVDALETQAKAEKPQKGLVKSYAGLLKEHVPTAILIIEAIVKYVLAR